MKEHLVDKVTHFYSTENPKIKLRPTPLPSESLKVQKVKKNSII